ncbi:glycosyltransferase [Devosia sp. J2-20]|uniref:glycosyltransferase n=1 Tax=Devosia sp. J2-20 TaxID=3026161 RepID=UPI00249A389A|nr:glycosyltransferase [Devosia sp. J2-20]WDQ97569.1 glycosyltransferase [Devosia sp. J2-20]
MVVEASPHRRRFLFISNGHGEDWIASAIVARLPKSIEVNAYPMIGAGNAYTGVCPIVGPRATLASEGWRNVKGSLQRDLTSGGLKTIPPALRFLREIRGRYERVIIVGDVTGVLAAYACGLRDLIYLDVYKTGAARLYSAAERFVIKRTCTTAFCRADNLAQTLEQVGVDARSAGNVMMDTIPGGDYDAQSRRTRPLAVTLLPGSRALTAESFELQIDALRSLPADQRPDIFLAVAGGINIDDLAKKTGLRRTHMLSAESDDLGELSDGTLSVHMARGGAMGNLLAASDLVLSQAGTATVQALGLGKPAITFVNPRDRRSRFNDEQKLFGEARTVVPAEAAAIGAALRGLLENDEERRRQAAIGRQNIGGPGAMQAILEAIEA